MFHVKHLSGRGQKSYKPETAFAALCVRSREKIVFCGIRLGNAVRANNSGIWASLPFALSPGSGLPGDPRCLSVRRLLLRCPLQPVRQIGRLKLDEHPHKLRLPVCPRLFENALQMRTRRR
jgi:hypothetical protein